MSNITFDKVIEVAQSLEKFKINIEWQHVESRCPFCGDSKTKRNVRRFHVDFYGKYNTYIYKCHRCGVSGDLIGLYGHLNNVPYKEAKDYLEDKVYDPTKIRELFLNPVEMKYESDEKIESDGNLDINFNTQCYSIDSKEDSKVAKNAINHLKNFINNRKIPDSLKLYIAHSGKYSSRIIIPIYIENKIVYFQGRSIYDDVTPKYLNPKVKKSDIILNVDNFDPNKYIVVCEGIIDAHMIENNQGTCVIGGYIDKKYLNKLTKMTNKGVIICLDNPKKDENSYKVLKKLIDENINKYRSDLKFFIMPKKYNEAKDLNDLVKDFNLKNVYDFVVDNSYDILYMKQFLMTKSQ